MRPGWSAPLLAPGRDECCDDCRGRRGRDRCGRTRRLNPDGLMGFDFMTMYLSSCSEWLFLGGVCRTLPCRCRRGSYCRAGRRQGLLSEASACSFLPLKSVRAAQGRRRPAASRPPRAPVIRWRGGDSARQRSSAKGQRSLKRQPPSAIGMPAVGPGPAPRRSSIGAPSRSGSGAEATSSWV